MSDHQAPPVMLRNFWYPVMPASRLKRGQMVRQILLNSLIVCRDNQGRVFVLDDHCPHRAMPLSYGTFDGELVECCYQDGSSTGRAGAATSHPFFPILRSR
jgi:phenylpropionate dioxygenase-like ring-hydroxylating dioxygenase large terminal subunit